MEKFELNAENLPSLSEAEAIEKSRNQMVVGREQIGELVEKPLLSACQILYDKNIQTLSSSANKKDIESGEVYMIINFGNLSAENQEIAKQYGDVINYDAFSAVKITIPVNEKVSVLEIEQKTEKIANAFKKQPMTWATTYTIEELKSAFGISSNKDAYNNPKEWEKESGYYYDEKDKLFYVSEEHYKKVKNI